MASGTAAAVGTGAFSAFETDREATIEVVDDTEAYVGLVPGDDWADEEDGRNALDGAYAKIADNGKLEITIDRLNPQSKTEFRNVFRLQNNTGADRDDKPGDKQFAFAFEGDNADAVNVIVDGEDRSDGSPFTVVPGADERVDLFIDASDLEEGDEVATEMTITAAEPEDGSNPDFGQGAGSDGS